MRKAEALVALALIGAACSTGTEWAYPWQPLPPTAVAARLPERPISDAEARHLLRRTGFGVASPAEVAALKGLDFEHAVDRLLDGMRPSPVTPAPAWAEEVQLTAKERGNLSVESREAYKKLWQGRRRELKEWWIGEMLDTESPLTERMALFWHGHFTSSLKKVDFAPYMYAQNALFRREAAGNFARLLREVSKGPAMLIYLDNRDNRQTHPNENFARELLELFTLGEGHGYTEADIRESARALTGWRIDDRDGRFQFQSKVHDYGTKTFLGFTGRLDGDDVLAIILNQYRTAEYVTERLWREFVNDAPDEAEVARLADLFRRSGYEIKPLLKGLLMTPAFRREDNRGLLVKSPVDIVIGSYRLLGQQPGEPKRLEAALRRMGEDVLDPPNVKGWPGGLAWITAQTLGERQQFLTGLVRETVEKAARGGNGSMRGGPMTRVAAASPRLPRAAAWDPLGADPAATEKALLAVQPVVAPAPGEKPDRRLRQLLLDPSFQLK